MTEIKVLRIKMNDLQKTIESVKSNIIKEMLAEEKLRSSIDNMLAEMDSLTRIKLKLQRKKQLTTQEQAQMNKLNKLHDANSNKVQDVDMEITTIINKRREVMQELQKIIDTALDLNNRINELEGIIK